MKYISFVTMGNHSHKTKEYKQHHEHSHVGILGENTELYFAIFAGFFFFAGLILEFLFTLDPIWPKFSYLVSLIFGGYYTSIEAFTKLRKGQFEFDFLMLIAAIAAVYIDQWAEASLLLFLFSLGHSLEHYAMNKARNNILSLGDLRPKTAFLKQNNELIEIPIEQLKVGDVIVVKPNSKIAADGVIVKGFSDVNQASITGESMPVAKFEFTGDIGIKNFEDFDRSHVVFTGSINGDQALEVKVMKLVSESTISKLISMVIEVEDKKSPTQLLTKKFEKYYVPLVIIFVILLGFAFLVLDESREESLYRAITVLVAASPCALAISTPSAVLSGVARAARGGVLIKGGRALENLGEINTIAFDKTGTLTEGKPRLTTIVSFNNYPLQELKELVYFIESLSHHPLARAISNDLEKEVDFDNPKIIHDVKSVHGQGIVAEYEGKKILIGNQAMMYDHNLLIPETIKEQMMEMQTKGETAMLVAYQQMLIGLIGVMDLPRETAKETLQKLRSMGIQHMHMLTGDHQKVGENIAQQIGIDSVRGNIMPEEKVEAIKELLEKHNKVAMVGDGVNDAPAMAQATVGVAMGAAGSEVALETAEVALMSDKIERLPFLIGLSRASKRIIRQNIWISMGMVAFLVPAALFGIAKIGPAVILHEGSTLVVVFNALRLLVYKDKS